MQDLSVTLVQCPLVWEDPEANRQALSARLAALPSDCDLVILPEMFSSGFTMNREAVAEPASGGASLVWMQAQARLHDLALVGSLIVQDVDATADQPPFFNRCYVVLPDGQVFHADKRHLFRMGGEHQYYQPGRERLIVEFRGWRILPLVCYDLRFPVWSRNRGDYDLALYVANWPAPRRHHWRTLLTARAIENQAYVAGVNRIGDDGVGLHYSGDSLLVAPDGALLIDAEAGEGLFSQRLSAAELAAYRERFPAYRDADPFQLEL